MPLHLFEAYGVELEYMIVEKESLKVAPLADRLIHAAVGSFASDVDCGDIAWSNELVNHVVELKTNGPAPTLEGLDVRFQENIGRINGLLAPLGAMLLPTAAHPFMDPLTETVLWPHEYNEVYSLYNRIFDCRGHGWSNLQSTHINLPFGNDAEFGRLHAAIRLLLPIIPALAASSPVLDGQPAGFLDARLETYRHNQKSMPVLAGSVVPEAVFSQQDYQSQVFDKINAAIGPYDTENVLDHHFLNSRGAIARFDRGSIEIRVIDIQECPQADLALLQFFTALLKLLVAETWESYETQKSWHEAPLVKVFLETVKHGRQAVIEDSFYLRMFGLRAKRLTCGELWAHLFTELANVRGGIPHTALPLLNRYLAHGPLSERIMKRLNGRYAREDLKSVWGELAVCLREGRQFLP